MMLLFATSATAGLYKWVDENGSVHYSDQEPAAAEDSFTEVDLDKSSISTIKSDLNSQNQVELYATSWCTYCKKARAFFRKHHVLFREYDIEKDPAAAVRKKKLDSRPGVPFVVINGVKIHGYMESAYAKALKSN